MRPTNSPPLDLVAVVADKSMELALNALLARPAAMGINRILHTTYVHPERDPGLLRKAAAFLAPHLLRARFAIVMLDHSGCGRDSDPRETLEAEIEAALKRAGWSQRAAAIMIHPELEAWVWSDSPHVPEVLGWSGRLPDLRTWLRQESHWSDMPKPHDPKSAMDAALRATGIPRSSSLFEKLARRVSVHRCEDPAFRKLCNTLQQWFPPSAPPTTSP